MCFIVSVWLVKILSVGVFSDGCVHFVGTVILQAGRLDGGSVGQMVGRWVSRKGKAQTIWPDHDSVFCWAAHCLGPNLRVQTAETMSSRLEVYCHRA